MSDYDVLSMSDRVLYQVTLASGRIVTRPEDFGDATNGAFVDYFHPIFSEDGRMLTIEAEARRIEAERPARLTS